MYLQSLEIINYRKFGTKNNIIEFVQADYKKTVGVSQDKSESKVIPDSPQGKLELKNFAASATTLIIGKNNAGKTTVVKALKQVIDNEKITGATFNLNYIKNLFDQYVKIFAGFSEQDSDKFRKLEVGKVELPEIRFKLKVGLDSDVKTTSVQNLKNLILVEDNKVRETILLDVKFYIREEEHFKELVYKIFFYAGKTKKTVKFNDFIKLIDKTDFIRHIFDIKGSRISSTLFNINNLFDLKTIKANLDDGDTTLSSVFNKIVQYRLRDEDNSVRVALENQISKINIYMDQHIGKYHEDAVNDVVREMTDEKNMLVNLRSNLDFESLFKKLISYEFKENNNFIPENQFGLGYSNLMKILGQIIDYVEQYDESKTHDKVNLICIEEPENFMHPQMQESFIKNIDDALAVLLGNADKKNINSQLIITTHSPHIVNSKVHSSNSFNNINYITTDEANLSHVVRLNDNAISGGNLSKNEGENKLKELKFLKKHIKYKVSELFFSDAVILVEGITEEHLLQHYINESKKLYKYGISILNIAGAYGHIYKPLLELLNIPCLVITDLDIKRAPADKGNETPKIFKQISKLDDHVTTNSVLHKYVCKEPLPDDKNLKSLLLPNEIDYFSEGNFKVVFQKDPINGFIASSFEEAYILQNYDNDILNSTLIDLKPKIYRKIVGAVGKENKDNNRSMSYEWQCKLASSKSDFANTLLYKIITSDDENPPLPTYINDGLTWLTTRLRKRLVLDNEV
jgi:putative ATP-dependent endonuclease of OLD family